MIQPPARGPGLRRHPRHRYLRQHHHSGHHAIAPLFSIQSENDSGVRTLLTREFVSPASCNRIRIRFEFPGVDDLFIDDISLVEVHQPCPDPAEPDDDDGIEDANRNGRVDEGDSDPNDSEDFVGGFDG